MIYILGAGAMGRETLGIYKALGKFDQVAAFIEQNCDRVGRKIHGKEVMDASVIETLRDDTSFVGAMGAPKRRRWIEEIEARGFGFDTVIHPSATIDEFTAIGTGCIVCPGVVLTCDIKVGQHSIVNIGTTINHDCEIGSFVSIGPSVSIAGRVTIGDGCWISVGTKIINRISIGKGSLIAAGSVVTKDIPPGVLAVGVPAKPIREVSEIDWRKVI